jgi:chemotaxis protein methyltransferase WspC
MSRVESNETAVDKAAAALRTWIGLDPDTIGRAAVERAVRQACRTQPGGDPDGFVARLATDAGLRERLVEEVVVAESWFFRDPPVFEFLRRLATSWMGEPKHGPLRVLCVPCAAGEEPYSVAITFLDAGLTPERFEIDAFDVSRVGLGRADEARYSINAFRNADLGFRDRWFRQSGGFWELLPGPRDAVRFAWGNLLADDFLPGAAAYDVVLCRNLLIYLAGEARRRAERVLDRLVAADGILVLGAAEPPILRGDWVPAAATSMFTLRRGLPVPFVQSPASAVPAPPAPARRPLDAIAAGGAPRQAPGPAPAGQAASPAEPADSSSAATAAGDVGDAADVVREAGLLANAGRHADAIALCHRHEAAAGPSAAVAFLLAMLHQAAGDADRAEDCLRKTLYLDPVHDEALLALALAAHRRGDATGAEHYRRAAVRALARRGAT